MTDFSGRLLPDPGFAGDDGGADADLLRALAEAAAGGDPYAAYRALAGSRLVVGVVAVPDEAAGEPSGQPTARAREKEADMALLTLVSPDGITAIPAFTSLAALAAWRPEARPVPVTTERACQAVIGEAAEALVIDVAGPATITLTGAALRAFAAGRVPCPPQADQHLRAALAEALHGATDAAKLIARAGLLSDGASRAPLLGLVPHGDAAPAALSEFAQALARRIAADPVARDRLDEGLRIALLPADTRLPRDRALV